jgi:hypothetical protein
MIEISPAVVEEVFHQVCRDYSLRVTPVSGTDVLLVAKNYAIYFFSEPREKDINSWYIDILDSSGGVRAVYALWLFLAAKRPAPSVYGKIPFTSGPERTRIVLSRIRDHLLEKGSDILRGEKEWIKDYPWPGGAVSDDVKNAVRDTLRKWET